MLLALFLQSTENVETKRYIMNTPLGHWETIKQKKSSGIQRQQSRELVKTLQAQT